MDETVQKEEKPVKSTAKKADDKKTVNKDKNKSKNKKNNNLTIQLIKYGILGILVFVMLVSGFLWYVYYGPRWGTMHYGVCKVFTEKYIDFPPTMKIREVEYYRMNARVFTSHIDAAGQFNYNVIECTFGKPGSMEITRVRVDRKIISDVSPDLDPNEHINPEILKGFNTGLNAILLNPPDLLIPRSKRNAELEDLWQGE